MLDNTVHLSFGNLFLFLLRTGVHDINCILTRSSLPLQFKIIKSCNTKMHANEGLIKKTRLVSIGIRFLTIYVDEAN